jgi:hypothetical protein
MKFDRKMKACTASVAALAASSGAVAAQEFDGTYAGIFLGAPSGDYPSVQDDTYGFETDVAGGLIFGKNWTTESGLVAGTEIAIHTTSLLDEDDDYSLNALTDFKFRVGAETVMMNNPVLFYGFGGVSIGIATTDNNDDAYAAYGTNYGLGAEMMVTDQFSVGIEHTQRSMQGHYTEGSGVGNGTTSLRAAFHF